MALNRTERQHEALCTRVKVLLHAFPNTDIHRWPSAIFLPNRERTWPEKEVGLFLSTVTSICPSSFSNASHRFTGNTHRSFVCLSLITTASTNQEGLSPELSCSKVISFKVPNGSLVMRTKPLILPRANISFDSPLFRSGINLCSSASPLILIVTLAVVPECFQTPVLITMS